MTTDQSLTLNCPTCGRLLHYVEMTPAGAHVYECDRDGTFTFTEEQGLLEGPPPMTLPHTPPLE